VTQPEFDAVVFGATSFVGQILSRYLRGRHGATGELRWAIAGRSESRLKALREEMGASATSLPIVVADATDKAALGALCARTRVVCSTVGPFALYGSALVKACAERGTDYCDITGESQWVARMIAAHEAAARKSGARIVHCCGFDSIPSDLGVHFLQQQSLRQHGRPCTRVKMRVRRLRGYFSGGTMASIVNFVREAVRDPAVRKLIRDPYGMCPGQRIESRQRPTVDMLAFDTDTRTWLAPFIMATPNVQVVHRSNALSGYAYGREFMYDEAMMMGRGLGGWVGASMLSLGLGGFLSAVAFPPTRALLEKSLLPKPGQGPTPEQQEKGSYDLRFFGHTADGRAVRTRVLGDCDPGYCSTAKMLGEAVACLALDVPKTEKAGGFWTPATALGDRLMQRLVAHAGLKFEVLSL
jgi:short subunit dehydrogenase-like uncharacterized protein